MELASANWQDYAAGDNGLKIRNIFPGVDAEMRVQKGRIKTNLIVREWGFLGYDSFFFSDHYGTGGKGRLVFNENPKARVSVGEVEYRTGGKMLARIGKAVAYVEPEPENVAYLSYSIRSDELCIHISAKEIKGFLLKGALVIDPLVTGPESVYKPGSVMNSFNNANCSYDFNEACSYSWTIPIPAMVTVTNGYFEFLLETFAPCTRDKMRFEYGFGDDLCGKDLAWSTSGLPESAGTSGGNLSVFNGYNSCFQPSCEITYAKTTLSIIRACMGPAGCESSCVQGIGPFVTTIEGRTLEMISASATPEVATCNGDTIKLIGKADYGVKPYTYLWTPGNLTGNEVYVHPAASTIYKVTVRDACNQQVAKEVGVTVPASKPPMSATISGPSVQVCEGEELAFTSEVSNALNPAFQWRVNGTDIPAATGEGFNTAGLANGDKVSLLVTNRDECANPRQLVTEPIVIEVHPGKGYDQQVPVTGCDSVVYNGQVFLRDTTFSEILKNRFGCDSVNKIIQITVQHFKVQLTALYDAPLYAGESIVLKADAAQSFVVTAWQPVSLFADQQLKEQSFRASVRDSVYFVYAQNEIGCTDSASVILGAKPKPSGNLLPNVFTPDGDGLNDLWTPVRASEFPAGELFVYNRWGVCIYHSADYRIPWDGKYRGVAVPAGVYAYRLVINQKFEINDSVTILY
ncbi:gliding motility-associated C-terminal domain-containing protein [Dyadobacter sp. CY261]|uniref:gliding motility-associated C-terminal domain-containing protein n=1 Tax=Dyadobacter sp. CY261 TaxID=2907203 RepID=UPI001F3CE3F5|nr:gliding motility-associated C-terminal domain-containing protein [Dyadobacter sp. CY261]MCF0075176.1 gliding motility-associated C-terminal domain-containing protein [Dyadobacter sp. CY261]